MKIFALGVTTIVFATLTAAVAEVEVVINDARPVAAAVEMLEKQFGIPITYEDPEYLFSGDLEDITEKLMTREEIMRSRTSGSAPVIMGMKSRELRFSYLPGTRTMSEVKAAIQRVLDANNKTNPLGIFEVREAGSRFHVYPSKIKNESGEYIPHRSLLDAVVTIESEDRLGCDFIEELKVAVGSETGVPIMLAGMGPANPEQQPHTRVGGTKPARELLLQYLSEVESAPNPWGKTSWRLLNGRYTPHFELDLHSLEPELPKAHFKFLGPNYRLTPEEQRPKAAEAEGRKTWRGRVPGAGSSQGKPRAGMLGGGPGTKN